MLADAESPEDIRNSVGPLGTVLVLQDGSWIAIHYRDSHGLVPWSYAIALDSAGQWYESDRHYCGYLSGADRKADSFDTTRQWQTLEQNPPDVTRLILCPCAFRVRCLQ
jgi:hypothetical protein